MRYSYSGKILTRFISLILAVLLLTFGLMEASPMDPVETYIGSIKRISTEQRQMIRERWGVDKPLPTKISNWAKNAIKGDLGYSVTFEKDVSDVIRQAFSNSLLLIKDVPPNRSFTSERRFFCVRARKTKEAVSAVIYPSGPSRL